MICPRCQSTEYYILQGRKTVRCKQCSHDFSETSGTVWKSSKLAPETRQSVIDMLDQGENRYAISVATGLPYKTVRLIAKRLSAERHVEPKKEYYGPCLLALPAPSWHHSYRPTVPPYRVYVSRGSSRILSGTYKEQREAMAQLWTGRYGETSELIDANDDWIASMSLRAPVHR